jgi:hypothetical protein
MALVADNAVRLDIDLDPEICTLEDVVIAYREVLRRNPNARPNPTSDYVVTFRDDAGNNLTLSLAQLRQAEPELFELLRPFLD